jgi:hypothetical protein
VICILPFIKFVTIQKLEKVPYVKKEKKRQKGGNNLSCYNTAGVEIYRIKLISWSETKSCGHYIPWNINDAQLYILTIAYNFMFDARWALFSCLLFYLTTLYLP